MSETAHLQYSPQMCETAQLTKHRSFHQNATLQRLLYTCLYFYSELICYLNFSELVSLSSSPLNTTHLASSKVFSQSHNSESHLTGSNTFGNYIIACTCLLHCIWQLPTLSVVSSSRALACSIATTNILTRVQ